MTYKMLKLTPITLSIFAAFQVNAALYQVVKVGTPDWITNDYTANATIGSAIQDSDSNAVTDLSDSCFATSPAVTANSIATDCDAFLLAGETRLAGTDETIGTVSGAPIDGVSFREEAPFGIDNAFSYIQEQDDFESYCSSYLGYTDSICSSWASKQWQMWEREVSGDQTPNAIAFLEGDSSSYANSVNTVINQVTTDQALVGITNSLGDSRATVESLSPTAPTGSFDGSRAWKTDGTYTVGSVSSTVSNNYGTHYSSKAAIWTGSELVQIAWESGDEKYNERIAQGSMRDFVVLDDGSIYGVGFNSWDNDTYNNMNAAVFQASSFDGSWDSKEVSSVRVAKSDGTYLYGYSVLSAVNKNLVAIGEAKQVVSDGAYPNRPFIISDISASTLNVDFYASKVSFDKAGGKAMAINNYNEIVGQIDVDTTREVNGKPRRKRGYIYPYNGNGTSTARREIFNNQAWLLDDLTNGGTYSSNNNAFRIVSANDINDAGVIAATAIYCDGGYDSTAYDAQCGEGSGTETTVAVKLVPIAGATSSDIVQRSYETSTSTRQGASIGSVVVAFLGLVLFGRRRKSLSIF